MFPKHPSWNSHNQKPLPPAPPKPTNVMKRPNTSKVLTKSSKRTFETNNYGAFYPLGILKDTSFVWALAFQTALMVRREFQVDRSKTYLYNATRFIEFVDRFDKSNRLVSKFSGPPLSSASHGKKWNRNAANMETQALSAGQSHPISFEFQFDLPFESC